MNYVLLPELDTKQREKLKKYSDVLAHLLFHRGFKNIKTAEDFLDIDYKKDLLSPLVLKDMDKAVQRLRKAFSGKEKICIYSDYDADGIPGAVVLSDFFRKINFQNFFVYIPHRNREGFGVNNEAVDEIVSKGTRIIITIDCGITDVKPIARAVNAGIDVIVTDHHEPNGHKTKAIATINPKQEDCPVSDENICGTGVIFKVVQALLLNFKTNSDDMNKKLKLNISDGWEKWLLDLVGIATISDMVPLIGENRVFAKYGLLVLRKSPRKGLQYLLQDARVKQNLLNETDVAFTIAPRINAASRMGEPMAAYKMLFTKDDAEAKESVKYLNKINNERKGKVAAIVRKVNKGLKGVEPPAVIVKGDPNWTPSLMGLVASKIVETYNRPVFLWGRGEGKSLKGSCRSDGSISVVDIMNGVGDKIITTFGGHKMAGGFVVSDEGVFDLEKELNNSYVKVIGDIKQKKAVEMVIDKKLLIDDVTWDTFNEVEKLSPFGIGNESPKFLFEKVTIENIQFFGKGQEHLKLLFKKKDGKIILAIKFFARGQENLEKLEAGQTINLVGSLEKSTFGYKTDLRVRIIEVL